MKQLCYGLIIIAATSSVFAQTIFTGKPQYQLEVKRADSTMGKIIVEMFPAIAPNHVRNWDSLVSIHFYDSTAFHRVIPGFMIQGGDPNSRSGPRSTWGRGTADQQTVDAEFSSVSHQRGIISAARTDDINSATSQFFICIGNPNYLDREYSVYGHVISGMNIADSIVNAKTASENPLIKISMFITRLGSNDSAAQTPQLYSPVNDSMMKSATTKATLRWHKVSDAMLYRLQLATDAAFSNIVVDSSLRQIDSNMIASKLVSGKDYYWRVLANNGGKISEFSAPFHFSITSLSVDNKEDLPFSLDDVYPNPIVSDATIGFHLDKAMDVKLVITNILGRDILTLIDSRFTTAGTHQIPFERKGLPAGIYFYRLNAGEKSITKRMIE
jgi:peptidyl-prolyl cis-trans isomerase B (cyclophilin B)